jgi:hypothetical protein
MKHKFKLILIAAAISMIGCSSSVKVNEPPVLIKDTKLATNFTDEGVKIFYTFTGKLEKIEVYGQADAWKSNVEALAEADALSKLFKFVYGNDVSTNRKVSIIGKAIENAEDTINTNTITSDSKELESELKNTPNNSNSTNAKRTAKIVNETITDTVTSMKSQGKLVGVRKANDYQKDNGKIYVAVYTWSEKDQTISENIRTRMMGRE